MQSGLQKDSFCVDAEAQGVEGIEEMMLATWISI